MSQQPIINNPLQISRVDLYRILYTTKGVNNESETVSGGIFVPNIAPNKIKGVILFFHPTFFSKTSTPSYSPKGAVDQALAALFVTSGYIVVAPDYVGMGYNKKVFHPYILYPQTNAQDGLSMLKAANSFLAANGFITSHSLPLFVTGYSEGAAYALWFSRLYQEQADFKRAVDSTSFNLKMIVPISGAYSLSGVMYNFLFSDIGVFTKSDFAVQNSIMTARLKPALVAYTLTSYAYYTKNSNFNQVFNPDFFNMNCSLQYSYQCKFAGQQLNLFQAFENESDDYTIAMKISNAAAHKLGNGKVFMDQWNDITPLINPNLPSDYKFRSTLLNGDVYAWKSTLPTVLIYLRSDSVVSSYNSLKALQGMHANHSTHLTAIAIDNNLIQENLIDFFPSFNVDHITGFNYLFLVALDQFNQAIRKQP